MRKSDSLWFSMTKILVTGGAGFIGSHLVDDAIRRGHRVVVIDDLSHGDRRQVNPRAKFYRADITNAKTIQQIFKRERPVVVNHHAALSTVVGSVRQPLETFSNNVTGTSVVLTAAAAVGVKTFIFASTGGTIYGNARLSPTPETAPLRPVSIYALSKQLAEQLVEYHARNFGLRAISLRYGNVFGVRQDPFGECGVIAIFSELLKRHRLVTIFGNGKKTRDYVYIDDVVIANRLALQQAQRWRTGKNTAINIGCGRPISDWEVFQTIKQFFPLAPAPRFKPIRPGEVTSGALCTAAARRWLSWKPRWTFSNGVRDYLERMNYV